MTYQYREERRVIENDGNIGLFVDSGNLIYTEIDGKKVYFYVNSIHSNNKRIAKNQNWIKLQLREIF